MLVGAGTAHLISCDLMAVFLPSRMPHGPGTVLGLRDTVVSWVGSAPFIGNLQASKFISGED